MARKPSLKGDPPQAQHPVSQLGNMGWTRSEAHAAEHATRNGLHSRQHEKPTGVWGRRLRVTDGRLSHGNPGSERSVVGRLDLRLVSPCHSTLYWCWLCWLLSWDTPDYHEAQGSQELAPLVLGATMEVCWPLAAREVLTCNQQSRTSQSGCYLINKVVSNWA